jgi:hypothetical protein
VYAVDYADASIGGPSRRALAGAGFVIIIEPGGSGSRCREPTRPLGTLHTPEEAEYHAALWALLDDRSPRWSLPTAERLVQRSRHSNAASMSCAVRSSASDGDGAHSGWPHAHVWDAWEGSATWSRQCSLQTPSASSTSHAHPSCPHFMSCSLLGRSIILGQIGQDADELATRSRTRGRGCAPRKCRGNSPCLENRASQT